jgi:hypothetical protein
MNLRSKCICAGVAIAISVWIPGAYAGELLRGRVIDIGLSEPLNGIGGVSVAVADAATQKPVGDGITDAHGEYKIEVNAPPGIKLVATFSKLGYFARPTLQSVARTVQPQPSVKLSKENASEAYYKATAEYIGLSYTTDPTTAPTLFSAVASLPSSQKQKVFDELKLKNKDAYASLEVADQTYQATQEFLRKYKTAGGLPKSVDAYANFGSTGTVRLYGGVPDAGSKRDFERAIRSSAGVRNVQNDLFISK